MSSARKMVAAAKKARKIYAVTQTRRYIPETRAVERFIASGAIGKVTTVQSNFFIGAHFEGFRQKMQHVLLLDMAIHTFDTMRQFTKQRPKTVYATDWNPTGSTYRHGANASAIFEMTNGVVYSYTGSWTADGCNTSWHGDWQIVGTEGSMRWHHDSNYEAQIIVNKSNFTRKMKDVTVPTKCPKKLVGNHNGLIEEFKRCIKNGGKPETTCTDNIHSLAMVCGAIKSAETGRKVTI
jgi:predicted dehydrogenase